MTRSHSRGDLDKVAKLAALAASSTYPHEAASALRKIYVIMGFETLVAPIKPPTPPPKQSWAYYVGRGLGKLWRVYYGI